MMVSESKRMAIRRAYRMLRLAVEKTQLEVEALARLRVGRYWKIESGLAFPSDDERVRLARVFKIAPSEIPSDAPRVEAKAL